jgi:hypothetical protein
VKHLRNLLAPCLFFASMVAACSDVGGSTAVPPPDTTGDDAATNDGAPSGAGSPDAAGDAAVGDAAVSDAAASDGASGDAASRADAAADAAVTDATLSDAAADAGAPRDAAVDAPPDATSAPDASNTADAAADAAEEETGPTGDGSVATCVAHDLAGTCTATEQLFIDRDPTGTCYACLVQKGCIDDAPTGSIPGVTTFGDTGLECGDLPSGTSPGVDGGPESAEQLCLDTLSCALSTGCGRADGPNAAASTNCYCGSATGTACAGGAANSPCAAVQAAAAQSTTPTTIIGRAANAAFPSGMADNILQCAISNSCTGCY